MCSTALTWVGGRGRPDRSSHNMSIAMVRDHAYLLEQLVPIVEAAGRAIMDIYNTDFATEVKDDGSPVTIADKGAEEIILTGLAHTPPHRLGQWRVIAQCLGIGPAQKLAQVLFQHIYQRRV